MTRSLFILAALAAWLAPSFWSATGRVANGDEPAAETKDQDLLQGSWLAVKREVEDKITKGPFREATYVFRGDKLTMLKGDDKAFATFAFVLDPDKKTIKLTNSDPDDKIKVLFAIYRIERDTLVLTFSPDDFPKELGGPGKKSGLLTLSRKKP